MYGMDCLPKTIHVECKKYFDPVCNTFYRWQYCAMAMHNNPSKETRYYCRNQKLPHEKDLDLATLLFDFRFSLDNKNQSRQPDVLIAKIKECLVKTTEERK